MTSLKSAHIEWNPNPEPDIALYRVHVGTNSLVELTNIVVMGRFTTNTIGKAVPVYAGVTNYVWLTAQNTQGISSDPSIELVFVVPSKPVIRLKAGIQTSSTVDGPWKTLEERVAEFPMDDPSSFYRTSVAIVEVAGGGDLRMLQGDLVKPVPASSPVTSRMLVPPTPTR